MNLAKKNPFLLFLFSFLLTILMPVIVPSFTIAYLVPCIVVLFYTKSLIACLWGALGCGFILDILSPHAHLGLYASNFTITAALLYRQKQHFFSDKATTLPLMTFFFSLLSTLFHTFFVGMFEEKITVTRNWILFDLLLLPAYDGVFAFSVFILPFLVLGKQIRKGDDYFMPQSNRLR